MRAGISALVSASCLVLASQCVTTPEDRRIETLSALKASASAPSSTFTHLPGTDADHLGKVLWRPCADQNPVPGCRLPANLDEDDHIHGMPFADYQQQLPLDVGPFLTAVGKKSIDQTKSPYKKAWIRNRVLLDSLTESENLTPKLAALPGSLVIAPFYRKLGDIRSWKTIPRSLDLAEARDKCQIDGLRLLSVRDVLPNIPEEDFTKIMAHEADFYCKQLPSWILGQLHTTKQRFSTWLTDYLSPDAGVFLFISNKEDQICRLSRGPAKEERGVVCVL